MTALYCGPPEGFILDELEMGKRAATYLGNEQEGFGAWVNPGIFTINLNPVALHRDWHRNPHTGVDPHAGRNTEIREPKADRPVFVPGQRSTSGEFKGR